MIQTALNGMITIMLAKFMINDLPHAAGLLGNPGNPGGKFFERPALKGMMPKLPEEARGDFLFYEYIRDLVKLGQVLSEQDVQELWEGYRGRCAPKRSNWVNYGWMLLVEFTIPYNIYLDRMAKVGLADGSITHTGLQKYKTMMGGYYLMAIGEASSEVVDTIYGMIKGALSGTRQGILQVEGMSLDEFVKVLRREEGIPEDRLVLVPPSGPGFLNALERQLWIEEKMRDGTRLDKVAAIDAVMHLEHEEGTYVGWIIGLGIRDSELDHIATRVVGLMSR